jgi:protein-S-isoprenylcysteine O-methyltransferase Ste14
MNPDRIANTLTVCLLVLKALVLLMERVSISGFGIFFTLIFASMFHSGMTTVADAMTGQKTIRSLSRTGIYKTSRDEQFGYLFELAWGIFCALMGALCVFITA